VAASETPTLKATPREPGGSRATRRLRRSGAVPGVVYGTGLDPVAFQVDARELRHALAAHGQLLELDVDGQTLPVMLKDEQRHPVRGETLHVDFLRVRMDQPVHATVGIELTGVDDAPGHREGGVIEHVTRELNIEALPGDLPEVISFDVSTMELNDTINLSAVPVPRGVTFLDDVEETVIATCTMPKLEVEPEEEIEAETELVGEGQEEGVPAAEAEGATTEEAEQASDSEG